LRGIVSSIPMRQASCSACAASGHAAAPPRSVALTQGTNQARRRSLTRACPRGVRQARQWAKPVGLLFTSVQGRVLGDIR
jgi:hypothetical protein